MSKEKSSGDTLSPKAYEAPRLQVFGGVNELTGILGLTTGIDGGIAPLSKKS